jgi:hypothetical protein
MMPLAWQSARLGPRRSRLAATGIRNHWRVDYFAAKSVVQIFFRQGLELMRKPVFLAGLLALALRAGETRCETMPSATQVFRQLGNLVGTWSGHSPNGSPHTVTFRYTAAQSVLVETWTLGAGRESMTVYALDGDHLLATHYCPQGNQPRLEYAGVDKAGRWQFRFRDGSNLREKGHSHQQAFWIKLQNDGTFERGETYVDNDAASSEAVPEGEAVRYTRVADAELRAR